MNDGAIPGKFPPALWTVSVARSPLRTSVTAHDSPRSTAHVSLARVNLVPCILRLPSSADGFSLCPSEDH
jgi:hypothetical protein